ncbi:MAG TPA: transposase [Thermodesulfobacteriota bacterium]|nr:transposase [Thermodesulfobacteriota bacterium]
MPRIARIVAEGYPHHITQRGNYGQRVFQNAEDFRQYLFWLKEYSKKYSFDIWAYCLMNNHVHFIGVPRKEDSLSRTFNTLHMRYSQYVNRRQKVSGHLWQGRFYSTILDNVHLYAAVRYVETNPVRARVVKKAGEYPWSSAKEHLGVSTAYALTKEFYLLEEIDNWEKYLTEKENELLIQDIRKGSMTGRPCGSDSFIQKLEKRFGRMLRALPRGRPVKLIK